MLYPRHEAAHQLGISVATLDRLIGKKELTARRIGRIVLIPHGELVRLARRDVPIVETGIRLKPGRALPQHSCCAQDSDEHIAA